MAPRANWKGFLRLSLVSCPIALYPASSFSEKVIAGQSFTFLWPLFSHPVCRPCILGQIQIGFVLQCFVALPAWCTLDDLADATGDLADARPACSSLVNRVLLFAP